MKETLMNPIFLVEIKYAYLFASVGFAAGVLTTLAVQALL